MESQQAVGQTRVPVAIGFKVFYGPDAEAAPEVIEQVPEVSRIEDTVITAATVQSFRWNGNGPHGFIYSFNGPQSLFVDVLMNVRLLFWAHQKGGGEKLLEKALEHCRTTARYRIGGDNDRRKEQP